MRTTVTLQTMYGLDIEVDFGAGEVVQKFRADVKLSSGEAPVILELRTGIII